ncbi:MAG: hypothetical protein CM15mP1_0870 [Methanobacteriota archaeon]|nr:MAG: hypothetical protein CM15mP1_0870 [Euryarchaeota archaeon]
MEDGNYGEKMYKRDLEDSKHMINSDMKAMIELHYRLGLTCDLSQIPLAKVNERAEIADIETHAPAVKIYKEQD